MITEQQQKAFDEALAAADSCTKRALWCMTLGLSVLAREYDYFATSLRERVEWQRRAIADHGNAAEQPNAEKTE